MARAFVQFTNRNGAEVLIDPASVIAVSVVNAQVWVWLGGREQSVDVEGSRDEVLGKLGIEA